MKVAAAVGVSVRGLVGDHPPGRLAALAALGLVRGVLETAVVVQVIALAFAAAGETPAGLPVLGAVRWTPWTLFGGIAVTTAVVGVAQWLSASLVSATSTETLTDTRVRLLRAYARASWSEQASGRPGSLNELISTSTAAVAQGSVTASMAIIAAGQLAVVTVAAVTISPYAALGVLGIGVAVVVVAHPFRKRTRAVAVDAAGAGRDVAVLVAETSVLHGDLRTNGVEDTMLARAEQLVDRSARLFARVRFEGQMVPALTRDLTILGVACGLAVIGSSATAAVGSLGATVVLLVRAIGFGQQVSSATHSLAERRAHLARLDTELDRLERSAPARVTGRTVDRVGAIRFDGLGYRYPRAAVPAVDAVDLEVAFGQLVGVVGPTGAGKSTLVHLLLGLLVPTVGRITADGVDLAEASLDDWHRLVAFVPQDPRLLTGTVGENIRFLRSGINDASVARAVHDAALEHDVAKWPDGLDHPVGPLGGELSGGQRQRIALARALAGDPQLLVLDEPTSALDAHSEAAVRSTVEAARDRCTVIVVAHRLSTLRACDRLLVFQDGRLAGDGTPAELAGGDAYYREALLLSGLRP